MRQIVPNLFVFDELGPVVNSFLWVWDGGISLIDTGMPGSGTTISRALVQAGYPLHLLRRIILTHGDLDHAGGVRALRRPGVSVACHTVEKAMLEKPSLRKPSYLAARPIFSLVSLLPVMHLKPLSPDELLVDGQ